MQVVTVIRCCTKNKQSQERGVAVWRGVVLMFLQITYGGEKTSRHQFKGGGSGVGEDAVNSLLQSAALDLTKLTESQLQGLLCQTRLWLLMLP